MLQLEVILGFLDVALPLERYILHRRNGLSWANAEARTTVNAFVRVDKELIFALVNAVNRTSFDASAVFDIDTRFHDHRKRMIHGVSLPRANRFVFDQSQTRRITCARALATAPPRPPLE
jgi:hypothetical protein